MESTHQSQTPSPYHIRSQNQDIQAIWLVWPISDYDEEDRYDENEKFKKEIQPIYIQVVKALQKAHNLKINILVQTEQEKQQVQNLIQKHIIENKNPINFIYIVTDDIWVRDTGPTFVHDNKGQLHTIAWGFNGWGEKTSVWENDRQVATEISKHLKLPFIDLRKQLVLENGAMQFDGNGVMIATQSSILNPNRNKNVKKAEVEKLLSHYLGVKKFYWLKGQRDVDFTDLHIDAFVRFPNPSTVLTMNKHDLKQSYFPKGDINTIFSMTNLQNVPYKIIEVPVTKKSLPQILDWNDNKQVKDKGSYLNYLKANNVILVPIYDDPSDEKALQIFKEIFPQPDYLIAPINASKLFYYGGIFHCISLHQPFAKK